MQNLNWLWKSEQIQQTAHRVFNFHTFKFFEFWTNFCLWRFRMFWQNPNPTTLVCSPHNPSALFLENSTERNVPAKSVTSQSEFDIPIQISNSNFNSLPLKYAAVSQIFSPNFWNFYPNFKFEFQFRLVPTEICSRPQIFWLNFWNFDPNFK